VARTHRRLRLANGVADLTIWWATLTEPEQQFVRGEAWSLAANPRLLDFLTLSDCPLMSEPYDPERGHMLSHPGRLLAFLHGQSLS
jgi:hypothetical protein